MSDPAWLPHGERIGRAIANRRSYILHINGRPASKPYPHRIQAVIDAIERQLVWRDRAGMYLPASVEIKEVSHE